MFYRTYIRPVLEYGNVVLSDLPAYLIDKLERFQRKAARIGLLRNESSMMSQCSLPLPHWGLHNSYDIIRSVCIAFSIVTLGIAQCNDIMCKRPIKLCFDPRFPLSPDKRTCILLPLANNQFAS